MTRPVSADALGLRADCVSCSGLCCVALPFAKSADFAVDKAAGEPCVDLRADIGPGSRCADLRGANLRGADLTGSIFLTRAQLNAARGDAATELPRALDRPIHWRRPSSGTV